MEEFKYFRGGATLVISLDDLNWFSRSRRNKTPENRDEEIQLWAPSGQMLQADEEPQPISRFCIVDPGGSATFRSWRSTDCTPSFRTQSPSLSLSPPRRCRLQEPIQHSRFTSPRSSVAHFSQEVSRKLIHLNTRDILRLITKDLNLATAGQRKSFIVFCNDDMPPRLFTDACYTKHSSIFAGNTGCHVKGSNVLADSRDLAVHSPCDPSDSDPEDNRSETHIRDHFHRNDLKGLLKRRQNSGNPGAPSEKGSREKRRRRVSFDDDVIVYMFDQEAPIAELHREPCTSQPRRPLDVTLEDSGLEWEDDFSALEKTCHFQCVTHPGDHTFSLPTRSWSSLHRPERFPLSQTCLFLTHVTESDLEL